MTALDDLFRSRWPNFSASREIACHHCGEIYIHPQALDALQWARRAIGKPLVINSAHRCRWWNALIGGRPLSQHLKLAFDISLKGHDKAELLDVLRQAGFRGFGYYQTFIHVDMGRPRFWFGSKKAKEIWQAIL